MLSEEEIRLKLGLDTKEIDEGTRRAMEKIVQFGKHSEKAFFEHGEKPARAFHKALHQLTEQMPILGGVARAALSPIGGTLAVATSAAVSLHQALERVNAIFDKMDKFTSGRFGNVLKALSAARLGGAADRRRAAAETDELEDPLGEKIRNARTAKQRQDLLVEVLQKHRIAEGNVTEYNSNFSERDKLREQAAKRAEELRGYEEQLQQSQDIMADTRSTATSFQRARSGGLWEKATAGIGLVTDPSKLAQESMYNLAADNVTRLRKVIEETTKKYESLDTKLKDSAEAHTEDVRQLKELKEARAKILEASRNQEALQKAYNSQIAIALRNKSEIQAAPFTPGLQELAGYNGPYSYIAREVTAARDAAKRQAGFANPGDLQGLNASVRGYQYDLGNEFRGATTYEGRQAALRKYAERMQGLISGRITPEHQLEVIADQMKSLNEKATTQGLVVRGPEQ